MSAEQLIKRMTDTDDQSNLCVVLRPSETGLEALLVADEIGRWSLPGGHAKDYETHAQACQREVKEESGLDVEPEPLFLASHAARKIPVTLFYALVDPGTESRPGGGDVTKVRWAPTNDLGDLNGTDKLAIEVAANRIHNPQDIVDAEVEIAEQLGYAVANVTAPPKTVSGIYFRLNGKASVSFARRLSEWTVSLNWPTTVIVNGLFESTQSALKRASLRRKLTPVLDCLLHASDALWRYESAVAPALAQGHIVIETGPEIDGQRLLERGLEPEIWQVVSERIPKPIAVFTVGEEFNLMEFQALKDSVEDLKTHASSAP
jgi:8-oxo-dGTP diphosphatase